MNNPPQLNLASAEVIKDSIDKGFHAGRDNIPEKLMLVVTELAEAMEVYRMREMHPEGRGPALP